MAHSTESGLAGACVKRLRGLGAYVNKNHGGPNSQGRPDLEGCYRGMHFGIELKLPGKEKNVTELQKSQLRAIKKAGGLGVVATRVDQMDKVIKILDKRADALNR